MSYKIKYAATVVVQCEGELEIEENSVHVFVRDGMRILPTFMVGPEGIGLKELAPEERLGVLTLLSKQILTRGADITQTPGYAEEVGGVAISAPTGERN